MTDDLAPEERAPLSVIPLDRTTSLAAWDLLHDATWREPRVYRVAGIVVAPVVLDVGGATITQPIKLHGFRTLLDRYINCYRPGPKDGPPRTCYPPTELATMMLEDLDAPIPVLRRIVTVPVFDHRGELRVTAGYEATDGLLLLPELEARRVDPDPGIEDVAEARRLVLEMLKDFPFASPGDKAGAIALFLLPFVRDLIHGPTPLHFIEAPTPGSGKGLLARACLYPGLGDRGCNWIALPEEDDELRKQITSLLLENRAAVLWDNLGRFLKSATLAKLLTDFEWSDRRLGVSNSVNIPVRTLWIMTGNNPQMSDELCRRVVPIRLVPVEERPEEREGFLHPDLIGWVQDRRRDLIWAAHILVQSWIAADRPPPDPQTPRFGSYEPYRAVLGGILTHADLPGFLENRARLQAFSDPDTERWRAFVTAWHGRFGSTETKSTDLLQLAEEAEIQLRGESDRSKISALGTQLGLRRQRAYAGFRIESGTGKARRMWRAIPMNDAAATNGSNGHAKVTETQSLLEFDDVTHATGATLLQPHAGEVGSSSIGVASAGKDDMVDMGDTIRFGAGPGLDPDYEPPLSPD